MKKKFGFITSMSIVKRALIIAFILLMGVSANAGVIDL